LAKWLTWGTSHEVSPVKDSPGETFQGSRRQGTSPFTQPHPMLSAEGQIVVLCCAISNQNKVPASRKASLRAWGSGCCVHELRLRAMVWAVG